MAAAGCDDAATAATRVESRFRFDRSSPVLIMGVPVDVLVFMPTAVATDELLLLPPPTILTPCSLEIDPLEDTELVLLKEHSDLDTVLLIFPLAPLLCMLFPEVV